MWQERSADLLKDEIEAVLAFLPDTAELYSRAKEPLAKARRGLSAEVAHDRPWPLLPLIVCEAICGNYECALPAAAALQLLMAAGDVFDDVEDADSSESLSAKYGSAVATNVATALLILAERALTRLKEKGVEDSITFRVIDAINSSYTTACAGQHLDLSLIFKEAISEDTYLTITNMKSASQIECTCYVGALLANTNPELVDMFAKFGHNLGMAAQITNDIQGAIRGSDILKRKITLPVIYAFSQTDAKTRKQLVSAFSQRESEGELSQVRDILFRTGAIHYATVKMECYKQAARDFLAKAAAAGASVERLNLFLE